MSEKYAMVEREGFRVPLIGIAPAAVLQECDGCHDEFPMKDVEFSGSQMLCPKCRQGEEVSSGKPS